MTLLTRPEAAARCRVSVRAFDMHVSKHLERVLVGRRVLYREGDLEQWARNQKLVKRRGRKRSARGWILRKRRHTYSVRFEFRGKQLELTTGCRDEAEALVKSQEIYDRYMAPPDPNGPGVYVILGGGYFKIGMSSTSVVGRVRALQTAHPVELKLLGVISANPEDERRAQGVFADFKAHGEWFVANPLSLAIVQRLLEGGLP